MASPKSSISKVLTVGLGFLSAAQALVPKARNHDDRSISLTNNTASTAQPETSVSTDRFTQLLNLPPSSGRFAPTSFETRRKAADIFVQLTPSGSTPTAAVVPTKASVVADLPLEIPPLRPITGRHTGPGQALQTDAAGEKSSPLHKRQSIPFSTVPGPSVPFIQNGVADGFTAYSNTKDATFGPVDGVLTFAYSGGSTNCDPKVTADDGTKICGNVGLGDVALIVDVSNPQNKTVQMYGMNGPAPGGSSYSNAACLIDSSGSNCGVNEYPVPSSASSTTSQGSAPTGATGGVLTTITEAVTGANSQVTVTEKPTVTVGIEPTTVPGPSGTVTVNEPTTVSQTLSPSSAAAAASTGSPSRLTAGDKGGIGAGVAIAVLGAAYLVSKNCFMGNRGRGAAS